MKTLSFLFCLLIISTAQASDYELFLFIGQSNMNGQGVPTELPPELQAIPHNAEVWNRDQRLWNNFLELDNFGLEVTVIHSLCASNPSQKYIFLKNAVGSSSLYAWLPDPTPEQLAIVENETIGPLYAKLMARINNIAADRDVEISGIFMLHGERDARYKQAAREYRLNLIKLVKSLRSDLGFFTFVYGIISPPPRYLYAYPVIKAQIVSERYIPEAYPVSTYGLSTLEDDLHYDSYSLRVLGKRFVETYFQAP